MTRDEFTKHLEALTVRDASFLREYGHWLDYCFATDPEYAYSASRGTAWALAVKMFDSIKRGTANKDGRAMRMTCAKLGIKHTYKAIKEYLSTCSGYNTKCTCKDCNFAYDRVIS